ncbi:MAG: ribosome-associated translation inhibitor RaiA [Rhodospirillaceae bacterium]|mgnify:CR=1 FL=1|jgi:ribosomal subunit interface protein|nr:ribosome-associated translation inhibitor RaiA [Rhodospirillaceae bacterium]MBT5049207.1 ribosome-associated translation inhibitor RaiA [Rhodospirillaceae bacterium]
MQVMVTGKQLNVGDALRSHVETQLSDAVSKYFEHAIEASVVFSPQGKGKQVRSDISVHVGRNIQMQGHAESNGAQAAFDAAMERIAKRLRRYKRRLRDHRKAASDAAAVEAQQYVLAAGNEDEEEPVTENDQPVVIAEMTTQIDSLTVGEAVMRMDLANTEVLVFQNRAHGGINVIYRRSDGNVGWVDPQGNAPSTLAR